MKSTNFVFGRLKDLKQQFSESFVNKQFSNTAFMFAWNYRSENTNDADETEDRLLNMQLILYTIYLKRLEILDGLKECCDYTIFLQSEDQSGAYPHKCYTDMEHFIYQRLEDYRFGDEQGLNDTVSKLNIKAKTLNFASHSNKEELLKQIENEFKDLGIAFNKEKIDFASWMNKMTEKMYKDYHTLYLKDKSISQNLPKFDRSISVILENTDRNPSNSPLTPFYC